jgi:hypothetical protein
MVRKLPAPRDAEPVERGFDAPFGREARGIEPPRPDDLRGSELLREVGEHLGGVSFENDEPRSERGKLGRMRLEAARKPPSLRAAERPRSLVRVAADEHGDQRVRTACGARERRVVVEPQVAAHPPDLARRHQSVPSV